MSRPPRRGRSRLGVGSPPRSPSAGWPRRAEYELPSAARQRVLRSRRGAGGYPNYQRALAWWIHDHLPYSQLQFFPKLAAFDIGWHERPRRRIDSFIAPKGCLTRPGMANHNGSQCGSTQARPSKMLSIRRRHGGPPRRGPHHQRNPRCGSKRPFDVWERRDRGKCFGHSSRRELGIPCNQVCRRFVETQYLEGTAETAAQQVISRRQMEAAGAVPLGRQVLLEGRAQRRVRLPAGSYEYGVPSFRT